MNTSIQQHQVTSLAVQQQQLQSAHMFTWLHGCMGTLYKHTGLLVPDSREATDGGTVDCDCTSFSFSWRLCIHTSVYTSSDSTTSHWCVPSSCWSTSLSAAIHTAAVLRAPAAIPTAEPGRTDTRVYSRPHKQVNHRTETHGEGKTVGGSERSRH